MKFIIQSKHFPIDRFPSSSYSPLSKNLECSRIVLFLKWVVGVATRNFTQIVYLTKGF